MKSGKKLGTLKKEQIKLLKGISFDWDGPYHPDGKTLVKGTTKE